MLRCLAFLLVFLHHSALFAKGVLATVRLAGAFGVCLFFFLSAFLITELLDRELEATGTIRLRAFYARRILRIWPLYFAVLLLDFGYMQLKHPGSFTIGHLTAFVFLAGNWFVAHHALTVGLSLPLWSISVEEQFYLVWPSVRRYSTRTAALGCAAGSLLLCYLAVFVLCRQGIDLETSLWVNSFLQFQFFASGAMLALVLRSRTPQFSSGTRLLLAAGGLTAFFCAQSAFHAKAGMAAAQFRLVLPGYLLVNAGCAAIFLSFLGSLHLARAKPFVYLGQISYGLYVFHWGMLNLWGNILDRVQSHAPQLAPYNFSLRALLSLGCTIPLAAASYRYFEKPILRFKQQFEVIRTRVA